MFDLTPKEFEVVLADFPLLDRMQPQIDDQGCSITKDLALLSLLRRQRGDPSRIGRLQRRIRRAGNAGAVGYVPTEQIAPRPQGTTVS